jgi:hypothetical protein
MSWTTDEAVDAWRRTEFEEYDPEWHTTICDLLLGKVEMDVVVAILLITHAVGVHEYEIASGDI